MSSNSFADEMLQDLDDQQGAMGKPAAHTTDTHAPDPSCADAAEDQMRERKSEGAGVVFALDQRSESTLRCIPRWTICASRPPTGYGPAQTDSAALRTRLAALCLGCMLCVCI